MMAIFDNQAGNDIFRGITGEYNQVDYSGALLDYQFTRNQNGSVTVSHPTLGTDTLFDIDGFWFGGERGWYSLEDALRLTAQSDGFIDANGVLTGNNLNNVLIGEAGVTDVIYGGMGDDILNGGGDEYDQVEMDGALIEWTFVSNADGSVTASHATWGTDTLIDMDGIWFAREQAWYSLDDAVNLTADLPTFRMDDDNVLNGTPGNDIMTAARDGTLFYGGTGDDDFNGRANAYDQVNYDGDIEDYSFSRGDQGQIIVDHPVWGNDWLFNIDGLYFNGKNEWYSIDDLIGPLLSPISKKVDDLSVYAELPDNSGAVSAKAVVELAPEDFTTQVNIAAFDLDMIDDMDGYWAMFG